MKRKEVCPVCGNEIVVSCRIYPCAKEFRCKYCNRWIRLDAIKAKGKWHIKLEEAAEGGRVDD